ncbi:hypothetical protein GCM10009631_18830 [Corynebacterium glaucum]|uniref:hypothetical protein n=1 Tax=Corynebacterium glaucum TaxID=187491 RepID=UPI0025B4C1D5|nr:hypothetical protein [Corynebacterium glaucum]
MSPQTQKLRFGVGTSKRRSIPISKIDLDLTNARFRDDAKDQNQAIEFMLAVAGEKCLGLLKDITTRGDLNPSDLPIAVVDGTRYRMLEGNRRLTCLKIWKHPALLNSLPADLKDRYQKRFQSVIAKSPFSPPDALDVVVVTSLEEADSWIDKKHGLGKESGASTVEWNSFEKDRRRFRRTNKRSPSYSFIELLNAEYSDDPMLIRYLTEVINVQYTTLKRLLDNSVMRDEIGIQYHLNGRTTMKLSASEMRPFITHLLADLAKRNQDSRSLHSSEDVGAYLRELADKELPSPSAMAATVPPGDNSKTEPSGQSYPQSPDSQPTSTPQGNDSPSPPKPEPKPQRRKTHARVFEGLDLSGFSEKIADLATNTSRLSVENNPDVVSILLRVILDLTAFQFLDRFGKGNPPRELDKRLLEVLKILDPGATEQLKQAETARPFNTLFHSIRNDPNHLRLAQFAVHSPSFVSTAAETKRLADRYEPMLEAMNQKLLEAGTE